MSVHGSKKNRSGGRAALFAMLPVLAYSTVALADVPTIQQCDQWAKADRDSRTENGKRADCLALYYRQRLLKDYHNSIELITRCALFDSSRNPVSEAEVRSLTKAILSGGQSAVNARSTIGTLILNTGSTYDFKSGTCVPQPVLPAGPTTVTGAEADSLYKIFDENVELVDLRNAASALKIQIPPERLGEQSIEDMLNLIEGTLRLSPDALTLNFDSVAQAQAIANKQAAITAMYESAIKSPTGSATPKGGSGGGNVSVSISACCGAGKKCCVACVAPAVPPPAVPPPAVPPPAVPPPAVPPPAGAAEAGSTPSPSLSSDLLLDTQSAEKASILTTLGANIVHQQYVEMESPVSSRLCQTELDRVHHQFAVGWGTGATLGILGVIGTTWLTALAATTSSDTRFTTPDSRNAATVGYSIGAGISGLVAAAGVYLMNWGEGAHQAIYAENLFRIQNDPTTPGFDRALCSAALTAYYGGIQNADTTMISAFGAATPSKSASSSSKATSGSTSGSSTGASH